MSLHSSLNRRVLSAGSSHNLHFYYRFKHFLQRDMESLTGERISVNHAVDALFLRC